MHRPLSPGRPWIDRRAFLQAGTIGALGLSMTEVGRLRAAAPAEQQAPARAVIFLFLTGGASQHDTFDMKPNGPVDFKGEFNPIATRTPGIRICEHMPMLAQRSRHWALVRSLTHSNNGHDAATYLMLTGRSQLPNTFRSSRPPGTDCPSIAAVAGAMTRRRGIWPGSAARPEKIYRSNSRSYPGRFAGRLGS